MLKDRRRPTPLSAPHHLHVPDQDVLRVAIEKAEERADPLILGKRWTPSLGRDTMISQDPRNDPMNRAIEIGGATGKGVKIGIVDSGIGDLANNPKHQ